MAERNRRLQNSVEMGAVEEERKERKERKQTIACKKQERSKRRAKREGGQQQRVSRASATHFWVGASIHRLQFFFLRLAVPKFSSLFAFG